MATFCHFWAFGATILFQQPDPGQSHGMISCPHTCRLGPVSVPGNLGPSEWPFSLSYSAMAARTCRNSFRVGSSGHRPRGRRINFNGSVDVHASAGMIKL